MKKWILALLLIPLAASAYDTVSITQTLPLKKVVQKPGGAAVLPDGRVVVADAAAGKLAVFSAQGKSEGTWGAKGKGLGQLSEPRGLAVGPDGRLYVADQGNNRVHVFSDGKGLLTFGSRGSEPGQFSDPEGVAVSWDGFVFVADSGNGRVQVFSPEGVFLFAFAGTEPNALKKPISVAVSPRGKVFVLDKNAKKIFIFSTDGTFKGYIARKGKKDGAPPEATALGVDSRGFLYVANGDDRKVEEFDPEGKFQGAFGAMGAGAGQFKDLSALSVGPKNEVAVVDADVERLQIFALESDEKIPAVAAAPTLRLRIRPLPPVNVEADDLVSAGDKLYAVSRKSGRLTVLEDNGKGTAKPLVAKGEWKEPAGIAAKGDTLYISDAGSRKIFAQNVNGEPATAIGGAGKRDGQFKAPEGLAIDPWNRMVVADSALGRVQALSRDGIFLSVLGEAAKGAKPIDAAAIPEGVAVLDAGRKTVQAFDQKGKSLWEVSGLVEPVSLASDEQGFLYVLDAGAARVAVFHRGQRVGLFGSKLMFLKPKALTVDGRGTLWVADGGRLLPFDLRWAPLAPERFTAKSGEGQIELAWLADPEKRATAYRLHRSREASERGEPYAVFGSTVGAYLDREIVPGLTYYYTLVPTAESLAAGRAMDGHPSQASAKTTRPANLPPVEILPLALDPIFSAQYKYYADNAVGRVTVKNNTEKVFLQAKVSFQLLDFMDFLTETLLERFDPGARETLELKAVFNNKILSISEDTPLQAKVTVTYFEDGAKKEAERIQPFMLYGRNAMSWKDPRRLATFVTPKDPPVLEFTRSALRDFSAEINATPLPPAVAKAAILFAAIGAHGVTYLQDPANPFSKVAERPDAIDYVQYPRETLKRKAGDCDDLTALYAAGLESLGVPTAILDVPGHVLLMFQADDTGSAEVGLPDDVVVDRDGEPWIAVEATMVGQNFEKAIREGGKVLRRAEEKARALNMSEAWTTYAPSTLAGDESLPVPNKEAILAKFPTALSAVENLRLTTLTGLYEGRLAADAGDKEALLQLGLTYAEHGRFNEAAQQFDKLLELEPMHAAGLNNRANLHMLKKEAAKAVPLYEKASAVDGNDAGVLINMARALGQSGQKPAAQKAYQKAMGLKPEWKSQYGSFEDFLK